LDHVEVGPRLGADVEQHKGIAKTLARNLAHPIDKWALPSIPWGDSLDEIYKLQSFNQRRRDDPTYRPADVRNVLSLIATFPKREADFLQYSLAGMEAEEKRGLNYRLQRYSAMATLLNREQEFAFRSLVTDAVVRAEFARRGIDFDQFLRDNLDDLARIGAIEEGARKEDEADDHAIGLSRAALYKHFNKVGVRLRRVGEQSPPFTIGVPRC
jgi:hypothetical protein